MVLIPSGSFTMGPSNPNALLDQNPTLKTVTIKAFYMDETEITNSEYRQFVNWVRDSLVRHELAIRSFVLNTDNLDQDSGKPKEEDGILLRDFYPIYTKEVKSDDNDASAFEKYKSFQGTNIDIYDKSSWKIDWSSKLTYNRDQYPDVEYAKTLEGDDNPDSKLVIDVNHRDELVDGFFIPAKERFT